MKKITAIFLFFLASCTHTDKKVISVTITDSTGSLVPIPAPTTALTVIPYKNLPAPFVLEEKSNEDSILHFTTDLHYPLSAGKYPGFDQLMNAVIAKAIKDATPEPQDAAYHADFSIWLTDFSVHRDLVSLCLTDQSYYDGAAHYMHGYTGVNYDLKAKKQIFFTDLFKFGSAATKQSFCDSLNLYNENQDELLEPEGLNKNLDFFIKDHKLFLLFDEFDKGPGMSTMEIETERLIPFINMNAIKYGIVMLRY